MGREVGEEWRQDGEVVPCSSWRRVDFHAGDDFDSTTRLMRLESRCRFFHAKRADFWW